MEIIPRADNVSDSETICHCERERGERERYHNMSMSESLTDRPSHQHQPAVRLRINKIFYIPKIFYIGIQCTTTLPSAGQNNMALCLPSGFIAITITCLISPSSLLNPSFYNTTFGQRKTNKKNYPEIVLASCHNRSQDGKY